MVDQFIMDMEYKVLRELDETERTPPTAYFLSAQSQMWIFAVYEILRTWREQAKDVIKWAKNGGHELTIKALEKSCHIDIMVTNCALPSFADMAAVVADDRLFLLSVVVAV